MPERKPNTTSKLRILIADDHELVRRGIRNLLETRHNWNVIGEAAGGRDAVNQVKTLKPDILILDITMPDMDGLEATRQIHEARALTRILILTMHESDQMVRRVLEAGALGYVLKSDMGAQLVQAVEDLAQNKISLTPKVSSIVLEGFLKEQGAQGDAGHPQARPTARERQVIRLLAGGRLNKEIAAELGITVRTAETHRARIMAKMGFHSLSDLIVYAFRERIIAPPVA